MTAPLDILCAGRVYADLIFTGLDAAPQPGREVYADRLTLTAGGGALITAAYAHALGLRAGVFGHWPATPFDMPVRDALSEAGVTAHLAPAPPGADPQLTCAIARGGDRAFVTRRVGAALPDTDLPPARHLHIGELATALEHPGLIAAARARGMSVSLDCGWDEAALAHPDTAATIAGCDLFLPNALEAERLITQGVDLRPRIALVVKQGAEGASALTSEGRIDAPASRVAVVDSTGAGDAFIAGFVAGWLAGRPLPACLAFGNACGAIAVGRVGGVGGLPDLRPLLRRQAEPAR